MAEQKVIGGPLSSDVLAQLDIRSKIMSKEVRTPEDLMLLNSNTGWAKMSSGVDVNGSTALAKKYVLIAGQKGKQGTETYSTYLDSTGFRPMPGITAVEVRSLNRFGVLKEATVNFNCWSIEQLTHLEMLYMRPGYTALLEWGHSIYTKNGAAPYDKHVETIQDFFNEKGLTRDSIHKEIEVLKKQSAHNYDGIFGFVKNFSWSFRQDGGYDCTTTIISIGELVESLQVLLDAVSHDAPEIPTKLIPDEKSQATILQGVLTFIKNGSQADKANVWANVSLKYQNFSTRFMKVNQSLGIDGFGYLGVGSTDRITYTDGSNTQTESFSYITLKGFCQIINALTLVDQTGQPIGKFNTDKRPENDANSIIPSSKFKTFKFHESINPSVCLILPANDSYIATQIPDLYSKLKPIIGEGAPEEILNILLNVDMLLGILDVMVKKPAEERSLFSIFESIFVQINQALGEINEIALHYDDTTSIYYIVDRQVKVENSDLHVLNVTGLKSTVTKFDFTTKLAPALTTMIAISAQAGGTDVGVDASALLRWNEGLTDRIISYRGPDKKSEDKATADSKIETQQTARQTIYDNFLNSVYRDKQFNAQALDEAQKNYSQFAQTYMNHFDESTGKAGPAGIVPFEVGIEMNGISGIKIGQAFKINEGIMPDKYNGVVGFIVTGIGHRISNNKWTTILKAQTIIISGSLNKLKAKGRQHRILPGIQSASNGTVSASVIIKTIYIPARDKALPTKPRGLKILLTAQAQFEGFKPGNSNYDLKNPGNFTHQVGGIPIKGRGPGSRKRFVEFNTLEDGIKTTSAQIDIIIAGNSKIYPKNPTLSQYIYKYAPPFENNSEKYINYIISYFSNENLEITSDMKLQTIVNLT